MMTRQLCKKSSVDNVGLLSMCSALDWFSDVVFTEVVFAGAVVRVTVYRKSWRVSKQPAGFNSQNAKSKPTEAATTKPPKRAAGLPNSKGRLSERGTITVTAEAHTARKLVETISYPWPA